MVIKPPAPITLLSHQATHIMRSPEVMSTRAELPRFVPLWIQPLLYARFRQDALNPRFGHGPLSSERCPTGWKSHRPESTILSAYG